MLLAWLDAEALNVIQLLLSRWTPLMTNGLGERTIVQYEWQSAGGYRRLGGNAPWCHPSSGDVFAPRYASLAGGSVAHGQDTNWGPGLGAEFQQDYVCRVHLLSSNAPLLIAIGRTFVFLKLPKKKKKKEFSSVDLEPLLNEQVSA